MNLSETQRAFLESQNIALSRVFDAKGIKLSEYKRIMKDLGYDVAINVTPCLNYGHQIRNRYGKCVQCNTAFLEFQDRKHRESFIYVFYSESQKISKVGMSNDPAERLRMVKYYGYGGATDWDLKFSHKVKNAGAIEHQSQIALQQYQKFISYNKDGRAQEGIEIFSCSAEICEAAIMKSISLIEN